MNKRGMGLRPLVMGIVLVVLFSTFMLTFVSLFIENQNSNSEILNSKYNLNGSTDTLRGIVNDYSNLSDSLRTDKDKMGNPEPTALDYVFLIFKGAFNIPLAFLAFIFTGITSLFYILFPMLSGSGLGELIGITLTVISSSIMITVVLLIVKAIRTGESER